MAGDLYGPQHRVARSLERRRRPSRHRARDPARAVTNASTLSRARPLEQRLPTPDPSCRMRIASDRRTRVTRLCRIRAIPSRARSILSVPRACRADQLRGAVMRSRVSDWLSPDTRRRRDRAITAPSHGDLARSARSRSAWRSRQFLANPSNRPIDVPGSDRARASRSGRSRGTAAAALFQCGFVDDGSAFGWSAEACGLFNRSRAWSAWRCSTGLTPWSRFLKSGSPAELISTSILVSSLS